MILQRFVGGTRKTRRIVEVEGRKDDGATFSRETRRVRFLVTGQRDDTNEDDEDEDDDKERDNHDDYDYDHNHDEEEKEKGKDYDVGGGETSWWWRRRRWWKTGKWC